MIVTRPDGKWRVTPQGCKCHWKPEKLKDNGDRADNRLAVTLNKDQFERWKKDERV